MATVLCTGADAMLVQTRVFILHHAGHKAMGALAEDQIVALCAAHKFDVAVIGQAASPDKKRRFLELIRQHNPGARVLELYNVTTGRVLPDADDWLDVPASIPDHLPEKVAALSATS
jgi:hypothetical protein